MPARWTTCASRSTWKTCSSASRSPPAVRVRPAEPDDWASLRDVRLRALADAPEAFASTLEKERSVAEDEWRGRTRGTFLAHEDGRIVGMAGGFVTGAPDV